MNELIFFIKLHLAQVFVSTLCVAGSVTIALYLRYKPETFGIEKPVRLKQYGYCLFPLFIGAIVLALTTSRGDLTYVTGIAVHNKVVLIKGVDRNRYKDGDDGRIYTDFSSEAIVLDKSTGKRIVYLNAFNPLYVRGDKMLGDGGAYYQVVDLTSGKVLQMLSMDEIKDKAGALIQQKIYELKWQEDEAGFNVRTMRDEHFLYDPIQNDIGNTESLYPFVPFQHQPFTSDKLKLFHPEIVGQSDGLTLVVSYDDLEKNHFYLQAISSSGGMVWSKRDAEISSELDGEWFASDKLKDNTVIDDGNLYFINQNHVVCVSLQNGGLKWIVEF